MSLESKEKKTEWLAFIEKFATDQIKVRFEEDEKGNPLFTIENIFDTQIDISNKYGFLSVNFKNHKKRDKFLNHTKIKYNVDKLEEFTKLTTQWLMENYPCRVFISGNGKILSFYDSKENESNVEIFTGRITVFRNVISAIVQLKIDEVI